MTEKEMIDRIKRANEAFNIAVALADDVGNHKMVYRFLRRRGEMQEILKDYYNVEWKCECCGTTQVV